MRREFVTSMCFFCWFSSSFRLGFAFCCSCESSASHPACNSAPRVPRLSVLAVIVVVVFVRVSSQNLVVEHPMLEK